MRRVFVFQGSLRRTLPATIWPYRRGFNQHVRAFTKRSLRPPSLSNNNGITSAQNPPNTLVITHNYQHISGRPRNGSASAFHPSTAAASRVEAHPSHRLHMRPSYGCGSLSHRPSRKPSSKSSKKSSNVPWKSVSFSRFECRAFPIRRPCNHLSRCIRPRRPRACACSLLHLLRKPGRLVGMSLNRSAAPRA